MTREQRDRQIVRYVREYGWTYQRVADRFGVTRQRAWQIVAKHEQRQVRPFWCEVTHGGRSCLRKHGHKGSHRYGIRQIVAKAAKA